MRTMIVAMAVVGLLAAGPAFAQGKEWNQEEVSGLVDEFVAALGKVQVEARKTDNVRSDQARDYVLEDLSLLRKNSRKLSQELRAGNDRAASWPRAKRCERLITRTRANAKDAMLTPANSASIDRANELIAQIGEYYVEPDVAAPPSD